MLDILPAQMFCIGWILPGIYLERDDISKLTILDKQKRKKEMKKKLVSTAQFEEEDNLIFQDNPVLCSDILMG